MIPGKYALYHNYPNPFNPTTVINFALPRASDVKIEIFNILGQRVTTLVNDKLSAGYHSVTWNGFDKNGSEVATGIYFYKLQAGNFTEAKKMVLIK